jgi:hypothetical protein
LNDREITDLELSEEVAGSFVTQTNASMRGRITREMPLVQAERGEAEPLEKGHAGVIDR